MLPAHKASTSSVRGFGAAILVVLASLTMAGCGGNVADGTKAQASKTVPPAMVGAPKVGDCWATSPALIEPLTWKGKAAVPCAQEHNSVTYVVGTLPGATSYSVISAKGPQTVKAVQESCGSEAAQTYLGHPSPYAVLRINTAIFAPTQAQWAAGARWFRCDLGSPVRLWDPKLTYQWQPLPVNIRAAVAKDDTPYRNCFNGSLSESFTSNLADIGKCGDGPRWLFTKYVDLATKAGEAYPGAAVVDRRVHAACKKSSAPQASTSPTLRDWKAKNTYGWCWEGHTGKA
jgi:hypothetical protein